MQLTFSLSVLTTLAVLSHAAYVPSQPWSTLTPSGTIDRVGASSDYDGSFALSIKTLGKGSAGAGGPAGATSTTDGTEATKAGATGIGVSSDPLFVSGTAASIPTAISDMGSAAPTDAQSALRRRDDIVNQIDDGQIQQGGGSGSGSDYTPSGSGSGNEESGTLGGASGSGSTPGSGSGSGSEGSTALGSGSGSGSTPDSNPDPASEGSGAPGSASGSGSTPGSDSGSGNEGSTALGSGSGSGSTPDSNSGSVSEGSGNLGSDSDAGSGNESPSKTADVLNQIGDGQVQQKTGSPNVQDSVSAGAGAGAGTANSQGQQSDDGAGAGAADKTAANVASQANDGQIQQTGASDNKAVDSGNGEVCLKSDSLTVTLKDGVLRDSKQRIGAIVEGRQFQFDGPPPQAGTIYAAGWALIPSDYKGLSDESSKSKRSDSPGKLALGSQTTFYKCNSGDFYNLYDQSIGTQCDEVEVMAIKAADC